MNSFGSNVQLRLVAEGIVLVEIGEFGNVLLSWGDLIAHQQRDEVLHVRGVLYRDLHHRAVPGIHRRLPKLLGIHLAEALVALQGVTAHALRNAFELLVVLAVDRLVALLHLVERGLADIDVPVGDEPLRIAVEERQEQRPNMPAVLIRVGEYYDLVVFKVVYVEIFANAGAERSSSFSSTCSRRFFSTLSTLPRRGGIAWKRLSRPCFAEPPAESPSTI